MSYFVYWFVPFLSSITRSIPNICCFQHVWIVQNETVKGHPENATIQECLLVCYWYTCLHDDTLRLFIRQGFFTHHLHCDLCSALRMASAIVIYLCYHISLNYTFFSVLLCPLIMYNHKGWRCNSVDEVLHSWSSGFDPQYHVKEEWWYILLTPIYKKQRQKNKKYNVILGYTESLRQSWTKNTCVNNNNA